MHKSSENGTICMEGNQNGFRLEDNEALYFLHIPKTAGTSFISILDDFFDLNLILRKQSWDELLPSYPIDLSRYKLFRGHFGYGLHKILKKPVRYITMLRNPVERTISDFEHYKRTPLSELQHLGPDPIVSGFFGLNGYEIADFVNDPVCSKFLRNLQTRFVGLEIGMQKIIDENHKSEFLYLANDEFLSPVVSDEELIRNAKQNLSHFSFVGMKERFEESIFLLCYTFGWKPIFNAQKLNVAPEKILHIDNKTIDKIKQYNKLDFELYEYAKEIFESRYTKMVKDLKEKYYEDRFSDLSFSEMMQELLERHYDDCLKNSGINPSPFMKYHFDQPLFGSGWHQREYQNTSHIIFRWTGPSTSSIIDLPLPKVEDLRIRIRVIMCLSEDILKSLKITINDNPIKSAIVSQNEGKTIFEGIIAKSALENNKFVSRLSLTVERTVSLNSINPTSKDKRLLGIAVDEIEIKSASFA